MDRSDDRPSDHVETRQIIAQGYTLIIHAGDDLWDLWEPEVQTQEGDTSVIKQQRVPLILVTLKRLLDRKLF